MVEDLGAADGGGRRGFQAELRPRKAEEWVSALLAATKEISPISLAPKTRCRVFSLAFAPSRSLGAPSERLAVRRHFDY